MLKANAWPYPVFQPVEFDLLGASFDERVLDHKQTSKGIVIDGKQLRTLAAGTIKIRVKINTSAEEVAKFVYGDKTKSVAAGFRILCDTSKFRSICPAKPGIAQEISVPLQMVRGGVQLAPIFTATESSKTSNDVALAFGAVVGHSNAPLTLTIDEDWTGETIPIRWIDFANANPPLPAGALFHVELSSSGAVTPELWLNEKFKNDVGSVINHVGLNSAQGIAGHVLRQSLWAHFWGRAVPWAIKYASDENEPWPATRIAEMWNTIFVRNRWDWPKPEDIGFDLLEDLSTKIQHHLKHGEAISQARRSWQL